MSESEIAHGELVYSGVPWKIFRQDAGMGEHDYAVLKNDTFFCRTDDSPTAHEIIRAMRFTVHTRVLSDIIKVAKQDENKRVLDAIEKFKTEAWARNDPCDGGFTKFYQSLRIPEVE